MKSYTLKILLLITSLSVISCMPDSATKFKEDPPKKAPVDTSGGTVVLPTDFHSTNPMLCPSGNGSATTEGTGVDLVISAPIPANFVVDIAYRSTPYSIDGVNNPNHEFIMRGDGTDSISNLSGEASAFCILADDSATTQYHPYEFAGIETFVDAFNFGVVTWSIAPTLPTGLSLSADGDIIGNTTGYNQLAAYTLTATNGTTGSVATGQIEIASATPLKMILDADPNNDEDAAFFYTQYPSATYTAVVDSTDDLLPNHYIVNARGALALITFIDYSENTVHLEIKTPLADANEKFFVENEAIDQFNPYLITNPSSRIFNAPVTSILNFYATVKTGQSLRGTYNDDFALHWKEDSGFTDATASDGLTPATGEEVQRYIRCSYTPDLAGFGIGFLNGQDNTNSVNQDSDINNWGVLLTTALNYGTTATPVPRYSGDLDRICEFDGIVSSSFDTKTITTKVYSYAGEEVSTSFKLQAGDIKQPRPLRNTATEDDTEFFFHYQYAGSDSTKLIITVDDVTSFQYNSQVPDENKISNGRGTSGVITFINEVDKKLFVTLENNQAYAFVSGDEVDNTGTFLAAQTVVTDLEYTFELGKVAGATTYFEPKIALARAEMPIDISADGLTITPFGANQFTEDFLKQVSINGSLSILDDSNAIQSRTISAITLTPNNHSLTVSSAFSGGIESNVSELAYVSPYEHAYATEAAATSLVGYCDPGASVLGCALAETCRTITDEATCNADPGNATGVKWISEKGSISYAINNYSGVSTSTCGGNCDTNDQVLAGTTSAPQIVFKPGSKVTDDNHGRIVISNDLNTLLPTQSFEITASDFEGNEATADFKFSVSAPPANLSLNRNLLLNVPSGSAFQIGSYISSNNFEPGLGIVKDVISSLENNYFYIDIQLIKGKFEEFDDLDNRPTFNAQQTYVLGDGIIKYNAAVELLGTGPAQEFSDALKCTTNKKFNRFIDSSIADFEDTSAIVSGSARGTIAYQWNDSSGTQTSQLRPTANNRIYLQVERGELISTDSLQASNCTTGAFQGANLISEIISDHIFIEYPTDADLIKGLNITSNDGANDRGAGVIHSVEVSPTAGLDRTFVGQFFHGADGIFVIGDGVDNINPYAATEQAITNTGLEHTFYLYRYEEASIEFNLGIGAESDGEIPSNTIIEFLEFDGNGYCAPGTVTTTCNSGSGDCSVHTTRTSCESDQNFDGTLGGVHWVPTEAAIVPTGLTFDTATGRIFGTPEVNSDKQKYVIRVTNPYGVVEHNFGLKVYDKYEVILTDTDETPKPDSFMIHQIGFGMATVPCRVTQEALDTATAGHPNASDVIDLTCVLDAGESDLNSYGIKLTVNSGDGICSSIDHYPTSFFTHQYKQTASEVVVNNGDFADAECGSQPNRSRVDTFVTPGSYLFGTPAPTTAASFESDGFSELGDVCKSGGGIGSDYTDLDPSFPNCDDGQVRERIQTFTVTPFICEDNGGAVTGDTSVTQCEENNGTCDDSDPGNCAASCSADCSACTTQTACTTGGTNVWTFNGDHNDPRDGGTVIPARECTVSAVTNSATDPAQCGGSPGTCMDGAAKEVFNNPESLFDGTYETRNVVGNAPFNIVYAAPSDSGQTSNIKLSNYMNANACITSDYSFDWANFTSYTSDSPNGATNPLAGGRNYYEYSCNGGAGTIARIRMLVRDFDNTYNVTDLIERLDLPNADNVMDDPTGGTEFCPFPGCNNRRDWDDYFNTSTSCGHTDIDFNFPPSDASPAANFPRENF